jgi:predicted porin
MTSSLKSAAAAAVLAVSIPAWAQNVSIYGLVDLSAGKFQNAGNPKVTRMDSGNMATSFIGFKGSEDLGGGLKANFALESFLLADNGAYGRFTGDVFWARAAWAGLSGGFGSVSAGRTTNQFFLSTLIFNALGDSFGYSPSIRQFLIPTAVGHGGGTALAFFGDTGWSNSVLYTSPNFGGATINLQGAFGEGAAGSQGGNFGGNVLYFGGNFAATFAYQKVQTPDTFGTPTVQLTGFDSQDSAQIGVSYDFGVAKLYGQVAQVQTNATIDTKTSLYGLGASVPVGAGKILAQYGYAKLDFGGSRSDTTSKNFTLAYDYFLSKRTDVYALYMSDKMSTLSNGNTYVLGLKHTF